MLLVKFKRRYPASFMAHLDVLRSFLRGFTRVGIPVKRSEGFNPHFLVYFTQPLPLSVESNAEYMCVETDLSSEEFCQRFKDQTAKGIEIVAVKDINKNPNIAGIVTYSDYCVNVTLSEEQKKILEGINSSDSVVIEYAQKDKLVQKEVRGLIKEIRCEDDGLFLRLASGNNNLRVDRLLGGIKGLNLEFNLYDIVREEQYVGETNLIPLCDLEEYEK